MFYLWLQGNGARPRVSVFVGVSYVSSFASIFENKSIYAYYRLQISIFSGVRFVLWLHTDAWDRHYLNIDALLTDKIKYIFLVLFYLSRVLRIPVMKEPC